MSDWIKAVALLEAVAVSAPPSVAHPTAPAASVVLADTEPMDTLTSASPQVAPVEPSKRPFSTRRGLPGRLSNAAHVTGLGTPTIGLGAPLTPLSGAAPSDEADKDQHAVCQRDSTALPCTRVVA